MAMKTRSSPAAGVAHDQTADVNVDFVNNETYLFRGDGPLPTPGNGNNLRVATTNADSFSHHLVGMALTNSNGALGAIGWGQFSWQPVSSTSVGPGGSGSVNVPLPSGTFAVWLGDPDSGDQAGGLCGIPANGNVDQNSLSCPIAFKPVGPAPAGGHVKVPDQGTAIGGSTLVGNQLRVGARPGCAKLDWLTRSGKRARIGLLNQTRTTVLKCLGRPSGAAKRRGDERWRYGKHLVLHLINKRVRSFSLRTNHYVAKNKLGVGTTLTRIRKALGRTLLDRRARLYRAVTPSFTNKKKRYADVRVHYSKKGKHKVTRIDAKLVTRKTLDRIGRRLAARTR
jgi:hypothetical protein